MGSMVMHVNHALDRKKALDRRRTPSVESRSRPEAYAVRICPNANSLVCPKYFDFEVARAMAKPTNTTVTAITTETKVEFLEHLIQFPNSRRVTQRDKEVIFAWLMDPIKTPTSQQEHSRRNYVRKAFVWNEALQTLYALPRKEGASVRKVVTDDQIADTVERVHIENGHAGWDTTWKAVSSSFYGILRTDVIFLLKRCQVCAKIPSKRSKTALAHKSDSECVCQSLKSHWIGEWASETFTLDEE